MTGSNKFPSEYFKRIEFHSIFRITFNYLDSMFFPLPFNWKMAKENPNHVLINMIGLDQTSQEIIKDGDVPIFTVGLITPDPLQPSV